ncbi:glycosyltransferase family 2 protein [Aquimarina sp. SS2-1]|uniref:glycosyltransferase family 2 protein n=1 Tax=Aquimarina besae TaxID=3342247 RepID=UPI00366FAFD0
MINKLYIVLINFNGYQDTIECLESILKQRCSNFQVLLIDNSTSDDDVIQLSSWADGSSKNQIKTLYSEIVLPITAKPIDYSLVSEKESIIRKYTNKLLIIKAEENKGFAAANNIALRYVKKFGKAEDFIWLLNNDTILGPDTASNLVTELNKYTSDTDKILFGTPLIEYYEPTRMQAIGGKYNRFTGITYHIGSNTSIKEDLNFKSFQLDYPVGASMMFSHDFLKEVGLMNESYFLFYEEIDLAENAKRVGGRVEILDVRGVYHKHGKSTLATDKKEKPEFIDLTSLQSRILFSKRHYKNYLWSVKLFILTVTVFRRLLSGNFNRIPKIIKLVLTT